MKLLLYPLHWLLHYKYLALFIWSYFEGEIGLMLAGLLIKEGVFDAKITFLVAVSGALLGDLTTFSIGKIFEKKALLMLSKEKRYKAKRWIDRWGEYVLIFERFIYGTHIPVLLFFGSMNYSYAKFFLYDIIGVVLWALSFLSIGYLFGQSAIDTFLLFRNHIPAFILTLLFIVIAYRLLRRR